MRKLLVLLVVATAITSCTSTYTCTVVHESPQFDRRSLKQTKIALVLPAEGVDVTAVVAQVDHPQTLASRVLDDLLLCFRGGFEAKATWQANLRTVLQDRMVVVDESESLVELRDAVAFETAAAGIASADVVDPGALRQLSSSLDCQFALYLTAMHIGTGYAGAPSFGGGTVVVPKTELIGQAFLFDSGSGELLYHGFVTGSSEDSAYNYRREMSFVGNLVRGALELR